MTPTLIRAGLIALTLILFAIGGFYRIQSQRTCEKLDRTKEGWPILIGLRLGGLLMFGAIAGWLWNPAWFEWAWVETPAGVRWLGVILYAAAVAWLAWMLRALGRNLTDTVVTRQGATFVNSGPYKYVRNPMYTGVLALSLSLGLALGTWLFPLAGGILFAVLAARTRIEERYLVERFGSEYVEYMARVGRFFPIPGR